MGTTEIAPRTASTSSSRAHVGDGLSARRHPGNGSPSESVRLLCLEPDNPEFGPIVSNDIRDDELHVIAELVEVLRGKP